MTTSEERMKILKMIQEGKITADEGAKLLKALSASSKKPQPVSKSTGGAQWLRVRVTDMAKGKAKVNVNLPLKLVDAGLNIAAQFTDDVEFEELAGVVNEAITAHMTGKIVDVVDADDGQHIEVFIE